MFFTQEDYRKIEKWLLANSRKDTDFAGAATPLKGNEILAIVQNGQNMKVSLKDFIDQLFLLGVSDFVNITDKYGESYLTLSQAIQLIPFRSRKIGQVITFLDDNGEWGLYQFQGERVNQWDNTTLWIDLIAALSGISTIDSEDIIPKANVNNQVSLLFADKNYNTTEYSGLGRVYLRKNIVTVEDPSTGNTITTNLLQQSMVSKENTIYILQYDYNLNRQTLSVPSGSVLLFEGGSISNGTIVGNSTKIEAPSISIFDETIVLSGSWDVEGLYPEWFGAKGDGVNDDYSYIQKCIDIGISIRIDTILNKIYSISKSLYFNQDLNNHDWYNIIGKNGAIIKSVGNIVVFDSSLPYGGSHPCSQYLRIKGLHFTGTVPYSTVLDCKIMRVEIIECIFNVRLSTCPKYFQSWYITNCKINNYGDTTHTDGWLYTQDGLNDFKISQCQFEYSFGPALRLMGGVNYGVTGASISQCLFEAIRNGAAIEYSRSYNLTVMGCYFEDNKGGHVVAKDAGTHTVALIGNSFASIAASESIDNTAGSGTYKVVWWGMRGCVSLGNSGMGTQDKGHFFKKASEYTISIYDNDFVFNTNAKNGYLPTGSFGQGLLRGNTNYNTATNKMTLWTGEAWVNLDGTSLKDKGTTAERPTDYRAIGFIYMDTTLNKLIVWDGVVWRDFSGTAV